MGKIIETRKLYQDTINEITKTEENWLSFLDCSAWNFKYDFADQILIYAQRPNATACAEMTVWNEKVHRWVNKNADGIFVFAKDENSKYPFRLVFDVSDTHNSKGTEYKLWSVKKEYEQEIIETLSSTFGAESEDKTITQSIILNSYNMVVDNIEDYMSSIKKYKKGTGLENISDDEIIDILVPTIWASVSYMMMTRCGINAKKEINIQEFSYIRKLNSNQIITILGTAISDIAEMGLREIAKTVTNLQKEEKNKNHTFVKNQKQEYSNNKEIEIGGIENGENRIHKNRRIQYTESSNGTREDTKWKIRKNEATLSKGEQESRIYNTIDGEQTSRALNTNTDTSNRNDRTNSTEISNARPNERRIENERPNEVDTSNEQLQVDSRGTSENGLNLQLNLLTEEEQKQNIAEAETASAFLVTQEIIDEELQLGSGFQDGKFRIYQQFQKGLSNNENADFLKQEYGIGGKSTSIDHILQNHDSKGITFEDLKTNKKYTLNWNKVAKRIGELINQNRYLSEQEIDEYFDWQDLNGAVPNNSKEIKEDTDYTLAQRLNDYMKDYDLYSYLDNVPSENTEDENIELIIADINDESNIKDYIAFLQSILEDIENDDELEKETKELINELEKKLPNYEFYNGDIVYIGIEQYEIGAIDNEKVTLIDTSFPLLTKEMQREDFEKKIKENPANDKLRTGTRGQNAKKNLIKNETQNSTQQENIKESKDTEKPLLERLHTFLNEYDIYDVDEVTLDEVRETLNDKQKILDTLNYFYELLAHEDILDEFNNELSGFINELSTLYEEKDKLVSENKINDIEQVKEIPEKEEKIKVNIKKKRRNKIEYFDLHPEIALKDRNNYTILNKNLGIGTPKQKFNRNIEAIKILKKCSEEKRYATLEEQEILSEYVGWGGLADAFNPNNPNWTNEYKELKDLLTEKEYEEARESTLTAFYTPPVVISSIYKALGNMGLERGNLLEPSCRYRKFYGYVTR